MAFIGGPSGSVLVDSVVYAFGKWKFSSKSGLPKTNNFLSQFQQLVAGVLSGTITIEGPYDAGNMPLVTGFPSVFTLKFSPSFTLVVSAFIESIDSSQDIDDAARVSITCQTSGDFTYTLS